MSGPEAGAGEHRPLPTTVYPAGNVRPPDAPAGLTLYPNPVDNELKVQLETTTQQEGEILIFDLGGRLIHRREVDAGVDEVVLLLTTWAMPNGVYLLQFKTDEEVLIRRFVKQNGDR